jgi:hypothetical protein
MKIIKSSSLIACILILTLGFAKAQKIDSNYVKTIQLRAAKIVQKLNITNEKKALKLSNMVAKQYIDLNEVYSARDQNNKAIKERADLSKEEIEKQITANKDWATKETSKLHEAYVKHLRKMLDDDQVIAIKDGMTYGVVPLTYNAYLQMLPNLTEEQKRQIYAWLVEARELAMDAESSEKKHAWFGKYKGKINNYLSSAGIDMKQAGSDWAKRTKVEN